MRRQPVFHMVIPPQLAPDLGQRPCGKRSMGLQAYRQHRGEHCDQPCRVETMPLPWHRPTREDRFASLPDTCDAMLLLPQVPDLRPPHHHLTTVHHRRTAGGALLEKAEPHRTTGWTGSLASTSRPRNPPGGMMPHQVCLPGRGVRLFPMPCPGVMAFACPDALGTTAMMEPCSPRWCHKPGVHGQGNLRESKTLTGTCSWPTGEPAHEPRCLVGGVTTWLGTTEPRQRHSPVVDRSYHTESILSADPIMASPALPAPGASSECAETIPHTRIDRSRAPCS